MPPTACRWNDDGTILAPAQDDAANADPFARISQAQSTKKKGRRRRIWMRHTSVCVDRTSGAWEILRERLPQERPRHLAHTFCSVMAEHKVGKRTSDGSGTHFAFRSAMAVSPIPPKVRELGLRRHDKRQNASTPKKLCHNRRSRNSESEIVPYPNQMHGAVPQPSLAQMRAAAAPAYRGKTWNDRPARPIRTARLARTTKTARPARTVRTARTT